MTEKSQRSGKSTPTTGSTQTGQGTASATAREMAEQAKDTVSDVAEQAKEKASQVASQARDQATSQIAQQKDRAVEGLGSFAGALRQTSEQLRTQDQAGITQYVDSVADRVERFASYLQDRDIGEMVDEIEGFARRQPALFLGGAFLVGLIGARFLKSSGRQTTMTGSYPIVSRRDYYQPGQSYGPTYERAVGSDTSQYRSTSTSYGRGAGGAEDR